MKKQNGLTTTIGICILLFLGLFSVAGTDGFAAEKDQAQEELQMIEKAVSTAIGEWEMKEKAEDLTPETYRTGRGFDRPGALLYKTVECLEVYAGVPVAGSPVRLRLKIYSRGLSEVTVFAGKDKAGEFSIDGSSGTGVEVEKEILMMESARKTPLTITLEVKNKGFHPRRTEFWPPRSRPLQEEGLYFSVKEAELVYPKAATTAQAVKDWLQSMKVAARLVNPDFRRFTFTKKPYDIPDKRLTPKAKLKSLQRALDKALQTFDKEAMLNGDTTGLEASIQASYKAARSLRSYAKEFKVHLIGNAHIDIAWLWRIYETVLVARNTFDTVIKNQGEYPELHFAQSQALAYEWIEKKYPALFEDIKQKIKEGRWEVVGGMWVEPDCNLISGESWVRQILYGKKYFKEKFGLNIDTGWNVDSFGYNWNMPQFYMKSGINRFVTQKIWWNDTTVFPYYIFWWQGVDGTKLLSYFPPEGYTSRVQIEGVADNITKYEATTGYKKSLILYGIGDHGGGPNREILNRVREYDKLYISPDFIHSKAGTFLDKVKGDLKNTIPVWNDELYLEYHRGTYTTQGAVKKGNRKSEARANVSEKLAAISSLLGIPYPKEELEEAWKYILTNQFHDILPGSSITPVYRDAAEWYQKAGQKLDRITEENLSFIAKNINTQNLPGQPAVVFNPLGWQRSDIVKVQVDAAAGTPYKVVDNATGEEIPSATDYCHQSRTMTVSFIARDIPPIGYKTFSVIQEKGEEKATDIKADGAVLENEFYRLEVNPETGNIKSLFCKKLNREFVAPGKEANVLQVYEDRPQDWDAWNIGYTGRMWEIDTADEVALAAVTPVYAVLKVKKSFLGLAKDRYSPTDEFPSSFFTQYIVLYSGMDRVDIKTEADWWEDHMFLKAAFPVAVSSDKATYEIPFAAIERTTKRETLWEKARFEVSALRWADLSDGEFGISLLNDSKYGHDIAGNVMKISLLRAPTWPDPMADRGKHSFVYSLYPHKDGWQDADTVKRGAELNSRLMVSLTCQHDGSLPQSSSFFTVDSGSVILDGIKIAEENGSKALIFRLYESEGIAGKARITFFKAPNSIVETNLIEEPLRPVAFKDSSVELRFGTYEIKTLKITF